MMPYISDQILLNQSGIIPCGKIVPRNPEWYSPQKNIPRGPENIPCSLLCPPPPGFRNTRIGSSSNIEILWKSYFPSKCVWKACFPILLGHGEVPASGFMPPHAGSPLTPKNKTKSNRGGQPSTWTKRGGICTDTWVCLHYWVVIWVAG